MIIHNHNGLSKLITVNTGIILFGLVSKNIKKYKGLTQVQLADICSLSDRFISDLDSNTFRTISLNTMYLIAKKLEIHPKQLLDDIDK